MDSDFMVFSRQTERQLQHWHSAAMLLKRHDLVASAHAWASLEHYVGTSIRQSLAGSCDQLLREFAVVRARFNAARSMAALDEVASGIVSFRETYMRVETLIDFYGDAINSRTGPELGSKLRAFDYIAGLSMQRMLKPLGKKTPPVLTYLDKGLGASILRAGLRLWDGGTMSPVAAVKVTFHNQERPTAIVHETGHQVAAILDWNEELTQAFERQLSPEGRDVAKIWASWATEVAADAYGFVNVGFAAVAALSDVVAGSASQVFNYNPAGVHPISYLRVLLGFAMARRMYGYGLWDDLERAWRARYPLTLAPQGFRPTLEALEKAIPRVVEISLLSPMQAFGGKSLSACIDPALVSPEALARLKADAGPSLLTSPHWLATESLRLIALTGYQFALDPANGAEMITLHRTLMERIGNAMPGYREAA
jgi:hypothetical protein